MQFYHDFIILYFIAYIIARHCANIVVQSVNSRKGLGAFFLQVLLAKPLVVGVRVLHCNKFGISAILERQQFKTL